MQARGIVVLDIRAGGKAKFGLARVKTRPRVSSALSVWKKDSPYALSLGPLVLMLCRMPCRASEPPNTVPTSSELERAPPARGRCT
jgi:hypothetical protein